VETLAHLSGLLSGLAFVAPRLDPTVMLVTSVAVQITHAIVCRVFAGQAGRNGPRWAVAGLVAGVYAVAILLYLTERQPRLADEEPRRPA
jgi:hypothetical protein